jgi:hypothetical protein
MAECIEILRLADEAEKLDDLNYFRSGIFEFLRNNKISIRQATPRRGRSQNKSPNTSGPRDSTNYCRRSHGNFLSACRATGTNRVEPIRRRIINRRI